MRMTPSSSRRAFAVAELLVAVPLAALLALGMVQVLVVYIALQSRVDDEAAAQARAGRVRSILREPIAHCGYGLPLEEAAYRRSFPNSSAAANSFFTWPGPISVASSAVGMKERERGSCRIVYAVPSHIMTTKAAAVSGDLFTAELTGKPAMLEPVPPSRAPLSPKNWVIFGSAGPSLQPFWLAAFIGTNKISLRRTAAEIRGEVPQNDELYCLRAVDARAGLHGKNDWAFFTDNQDGSGRQPRVPGVVDARFELSPSGRTLKLRLLARGDRRGGEKLSEGVPEGWPAEYAGDIPDAARYYNLYAFEMTFEIRNF